MTDAVDTVKWSIAGAHPTREIQYSQLSATPETTFQKIGYLLSNGQVGLFKSKQRPFCVFIHNVISPPGDANYNPQSQQSQNNVHTNVILIVTGGVECDLVLKQGESPAVGSLVQATGAATHHGKVVAYDQTELAIGIVTRIVTAAGGSDGVVRVMLFPDSGPVLVTQTITVSAHYCYLTYTLWGGGLIIERAAGTATGGTKILLSLSPGADDEVLFNAVTKQLTFNGAAGVTSAKARYMAVIP